MTESRPPFAPWDRRETPTLYGAGQAEARAAAFAAVASRTAELVAEAAGLVEGHGRATLERHADVCRWHASIWSELGAGAAAGEALDPGVAQFLDAVGGAGGAVEALAGIYRVLVPRSLAAHVYHQQALGSDASSAASRWLRIIIADQHDIARDGELLLESLIGDAAAVEAATRRQAELEKQIVRAGGIAGPGTLGPTATTEVMAR